MRGALKQAEAFLPGAGLAGHLDAGILFEQLEGPLACQRMVVDDHDLNRRSALDRSQRLLALRRDLL